MSGEIVRKGYTIGTHRLVAPERTLEKIQPLSPSVGVTRCANVTGLDRLDIPVYSAIRPRGHILQTTNGKGLRATDAIVSALMEAVEHYHAENVCGDVRRASMNELLHEEQLVVAPDALALYRSGTYFSGDFLLDWTEVENLHNGERLWLPASAVYICCSPMLFDFTTNGLGSGNHLAEATLHGLYEVIERDAVTRLSIEGRVRVRAPHCRVVDLSTVDSDPVRELCSKLARAKVELVLIWVKSCVAINTFWAVLLDTQPLNLTSTVNFGYGSHLSVSVAAIRAVTEAAQSRLSYIHGAREDLAQNISAQSSDVVRSLYAFFSDIKVDTGWGDLRDLSTDDMQKDLDEVVAAVMRAGFGGVYRVVLSRPHLKIPVVKVLVPGLRMNRRLF